MTGFLALRLQGTPDERGRGQARHRTMDAGLRAATLGRVGTARAEGLVDAEALAYLAAQWALHRTLDPEGLQEMEGIAAGYGIDPQDLFLYLHLGTLGDLKGGGRIEDGCSAWAAGTGPEGPLVVKNRDFGGAHLAIQTIARHEGPDVATGAMLCLGSLGSPGAYSSGINARGFALVDTQVGVRIHRTGWLRYFLMTRLLARCASVAEAIVLIRSAPHAGGGTLVMADAEGNTAAVELGASGPQVEQGQLVWRTNHYVSERLAADTHFPSGDRVAQNSGRRRDHLSAVLPGRVWDSAAAQDLMATHHDGSREVPICQHGAAQGSTTIAGAIYSCARRSLLACAGNPCRADWQSFDLS